MKKHVSLNEEEYCPVYEINESPEKYHDHGIDVDEDTLARWREIFKDFFWMQSELRTLYEGDMIEHKRKRQSKPK